MNNYRHFILVIFFVYLYGVLITALTNEGILWNVFSSGLKDNISYNAAVQYAEFSDKKVHNGAVIIGDLPFIELVKSKLPNDVNVITCRIPDVDLRDIVACIEGLSYVDINNPVIVNLQPYFFSNVVTKGNPPRFDVLQKCADKRAWSLCSMRLALKMVKGWSKASGKIAVSERAKLNELVSFDRQKNLMERLKSTGIGSIYWIEDSRFVDYTAVPSLVEKYENEKKLLLIIGTLMTLDELKNPYNN